MSLPHDRPDVCPTLTAGLLLAAHAFLRQLNLPHPTVGQVLDATGAGRSRAYELKAALFSLLPDLVQPVGRPRAVSEPSSTSDTASLSDRP